MPWSLMLIPDEARLGQTSHQRKMKRKLLTATPSTRSASAPDDFVQTLGK